MIEKRLSKAIACDPEDRAACHDSILKSLQAKYGWTIRAVDNMQEVGLTVFHAPNDHKIVLTFHDDGITKKGIRLQRVQDIPSEITF